MPWSICYDHDQYDGKWDCYYDVQYDDQYNVQYHVQYDDQYNDILNNLKKNKCVVEQFINFTVLINNAPHQDKSARA